jgi:CubicO group peptidase (beta-lactamase class C family)
VSHNAGTASEGLVHPGFERVREAFDRLLTGRPGYGAALCLYVDGGLAVDLWGGSYREDTLQLVFSCTKGISAIVVNLMVQRGELDLDAPVAAVWPEFGLEGKDRIPVRWLLTHQAGIPGVDVPLTLDDLVAGDPVVRALEHQRPMWEPGTEHGYHALTMGYLLGELTRRATGRTIGRYLADECAAPLALSTWIGAPADIEARIVPVRVTDKSATARVSAAVIAAERDPKSIYSRVFSNPRIIATEWNAPKVHAAEIPAANGITDARSLARLYAACISEVDGVRLLDDASVRRATATQVEGMDVVNLEVNRLGLGFYLEFPRLPLGSDRAFGHDGFGGALGFADPECGLALGFTTDLVPELSGADPEVWAIADVARACIVERASPAPR